jgi:stage II sporulation protein D
VEVLRTDSGLAVVNELPLESYLAGSLGREMHASWKPAALRAQAVASRTYALYRIRTARSGSAYHLTSDTGSQVYQGIEAESKPVWAALEATRGQVLSYRGRPILAVFHSASGGVTASAQEVWGEPHAYLISQPVEGEDDSPDTYWRAAVSRTTLGRAATGLGSPIGEIRKLRILARGPSGRAELLRATGTRGTAEFTGRELRRALGESTLKSTLFDVRRSEDGFVFVGSGRGHGVGMSQWGARARAERGDTYEQILRIFYPGAELSGRATRPSAGAARSLALAEGRAH